MKPEWYGIQGEEEVKIPKFTLHKSYDDPEQKLAHLLLEEVIFTNTGHWIKNFPEDFTTLHVNCNDIFAWGCADSEDILNSEIHDLYEMWKKDPNWGAAAWCIKKRKQMPQAPVEKYINNAGIWDLKELIK